MKNARLSDFIHFQPVDPEKDITLGWNRFFPTIFFLNRFAMDQLAAIKERRVPSPGGELQPFFRQLQRYKFIYTGDKDPAQEDFSGMIAESQELLKKRGEDFFRLKNAYAGLTVFNDECNLACSYCVNRYQAKPAAVGIKAARKWEVTRDCIARYITRKLEQEKDSPANSVRILFNGGEILLEWKLIKRLLQWLKATYPDVTFEFHMNTNLTLMTEEIAQVLAEHNVKIDISIDGYGCAHDRTRKYHQGGGSFMDVLKGLSIYRRFNEKNPLTAFQGTIEDVDNFDPAAVYEMEKLGFNQARLAPNLLNINEEDALKKARLMGRFLELNDTRSFQVTELFFSKARDKINRDEYRFSLNCQGLNCLPSMSLYLNLSTLQVSIACAYVQDTWIPLEETGYDIYHPGLWHRAYRFIEERLEALRRYCFDCHLVGLCSGGCIYTGLDNKNRLNEAACVYQRELWRLYIQKVYQDSQTA